MINYMQKFVSDFDSVKNKPLPTFRFHCNIVLLKYHTYKCLMSGLSNNMTVYDFSWMFMVKSVYIYAVNWISNSY